MKTKDIVRSHNHPETDESFAAIYEAMQSDHRIEMSKISHEIRNPVTLINSYLQLISTEHPEIKDWNHWSELMDNMTFLKQLLNDLSNYNNAKLLKYSEASPYVILESVIKSYMPAFEAQHIKVSLEKDGPIPPFMLDTVKMREVFYNILRNAAEAMPDGGNIYCTVRSDTDNIIIHIEDTGNGIAKSELREIMDPFVTHKKDGTGLGLAIVNDVVRAHKGLVTLDADTGKGMIVTIILPIMF